MSDAKGSEGWAGLKGTFKRQAGILLGFTALLWALELVDQVLLRGYLDQFGVRPRSLVGLRGVLLAPLLHGGFGHLIANTGPLLVLGWLVMWRRTSDWFLVGALATVVGGLGTWLIGAGNSVHIGASGVVFGFLGYLLLRGWFERKFVSMVGSVLVGVMYGGALWGLLPGTPGISWEGHLFGFSGGVLAAWLLKDRGHN
ncbi:MAG TPA: rhomboid family intramembrane serine protease [Sorangium sp.]|nr:rhomboid family intramembrane serine protease [Sorangium sp.]